MSAMATETSSEHPWPPCYYERDGDIFLPNGLARSPWDRQAIAGGPISALLATGCEDAALDAEFEIARFSVDIFGKVPHAPLHMVREVLRDGRQTKLHCVTLMNQSNGYQHVLSPAALARNIHRIGPYACIRCRKNHSRLLMRH